MTGDRSCCFRSLGRWQSPDGPELQPGLPASSGECLTKLGLKTAQEPLFRASYSDLFMCWIHHPQEALLESPAPALGSFGLLQ